MKQIRIVVEKIKGFAEEYERLDEEEQRILDELKALKPLRGSIVYKWVKNKAGRKYYYFYLHEKVNGRTRSIYLGTSIPRELIKGKEDRERYMKLTRRLREIQERKSHLEWLFNMIMNWD